MKSGKKSDTPGNLPKTLPSWVYPVILTAVSLALIFFNDIYLRVSAKPPFASGVAYSLKSLDAYLNLTGGDFFSFWTSPGNYYTPLPFQISALFYWIMGPGHRAAVAGQGIFILILSLSTYLLTSHLWDENRGLLAGLLSISFAGTAFYSRLANVDIPGAAFVPLAIYLLIRCRGFTCRRYTPLLGVTLTLGLLSKWSFLIYVAGPLLMVTGQKIFEGIKSRQWRIPTIITLLTLSAYGILTWFLAVLVDRWPPVAQSADAQEILYFSYLIVTGVLSYLTFTRWKPGHKSLSGIAGTGFMVLAGSAHFMLFHLGELPQIYRVWFWDIQYNLLLATRTPYHFFVDFLTMKYFGIPFLILFLVGLYLLTTGKDRPQGSLLLPLSVVVSLVLLYFQPIYDPRYFIPMSGPCASIATFYLPRIKPRSLRISTLLGGFFLGISYLFGWGFLPGNINSSLSSTAIVTPAPRRMANSLDEASRRVLEMNSKGAMLVAFYDESRGFRVTPLLWFLQLKLNQPKGQEVSMLFPGVDPIYPYREAPWGVLVYPSLGEDDEVVERSIYSWQQDERTGPPRSDTGMRNFLEGASLDRAVPASVIIVRLYSVGEDGDPPSNLEELQSITRRNRGLSADVTRDGSHDSPGESTLTAGNHKDYDMGSWERHGFPGQVVNSLSPRVRDRVKKIVHVETFQLLGNTYADIYRAVTDNPLREAGPNKYLHMHPGTKEKNPL